MISHESICGFSSIGCAGVVIFYEKTCFVSDVFHCVSMKLVLGDLLAMCSYGLCYKFVFRVVFRGIFLNVKGLLSCRQG